MPDSTPQTSVTVLGLGLMGTALAEALLADGRTVTVWNRSAAKAAPLVAKGARHAPDAGTAIAASPLVVVCLSGYANAEEILAEDALAGRTVVQLTSGTPSQARAMAGLVTGRGARYLDGGIMAVPQMIGRPGALILYSGDADTFARHRDVLAVLADARHVGTDPGLAPLLDFALLDAMYGMYAGFYHSVALARSEGITASDFTRMLTGWLEAMLRSLPEQARALDAGEFGTDVSTVATSQVAFPSLIEASVAQGVDPAPLLPMRDLLDRAAAEGHGGDALHRLVTLLERGKPQAAS